MGRISADKAKDIGGNSGEFFSLKNDGDSARVRLLYDNEDLLDIYATHKVEIDGKERYVECINPEGDSRLPACPCCKKDGYPTVRIFIKLIDMTDKKYKVWDRGKKFIPKMTGFFNKYGPLVNRPYDIERHGKAGDQQTTYEMYALDKDDKTLADFEKTDELLGTLILQKTAQELEDILSGVSSTPSSNSSAPARRNTTGKDVF